MAVICIDAGTTVIKVVGYDEEGAEVAVARRASAVSRPAPGWAEQDMDSVWAAVADGVREVSARLDDPIDYLAITAQGDGVWLLDEDGDPTGPAILWNDARAAEIVERWTRSGVVEDAYSISGNRTSAGIPNAILAWLREHDPERLSRSSTLLSCGGWLFAQLTGELVAEVSDASAPFMDPKSRTYSAELLRLYDMEWVEPILARISSTEQCVAPLTSHAAASTGLVEGTPVVHSSYDIASTAVGVGAVEVGQACSILGTTLCTEIVADRLDRRTPASGVTVALGVPGRYIRGFPTLAGGEVIEWTCQMLGLDDPLELVTEAAGAPFGAAGISFLPFLSPAGERAPFHDALARGSFMGLSLSHGRAHVARAVLEGLSLVIRDCLVACDTPTTELRVCGGGAANSSWLQIIADITGLTVSRSLDSEVGARGAYLVGSAAVGRTKSVPEAARRHVRLGDSFIPDDAHREHADALYNDYLELRETATRAWPRLAAMRARSSTPSDHTGPDCVEADHAAELHER